MKNSNEKLLWETTELLGDITDKFVFVGGVTTYLYITTTKPDLRNTIDVDVIIDANISERHELEKQIMKLGFVPDQDVNCRYHCRGLILDMMPINEKILGFTNSWYEKGIKQAQSKMIKNKLIKILPFPFYLATKIESFNNRGQNDFYSSKDMEDLITVLASRKEAFTEIENSSSELYEFITSNFHDYFKKEDFKQSVMGNFPKNSHYSDGRSFLAEFKRFLD